MPYAASNLDILSSDCCIAHVNVHDDPLPICDVGIPVNVQTCNHNANVHDNCLQNSDVGISVQHGLHDAPDSVSHVSSVFECDATTVECADTIVSSSGLSSPDTNVLLPVRHNPTCVCGSCLHVPSVPHSPSHVPVTTPYRHVSDLTCPHSVDDVPTNFDNLTGVTNDLPVTCPRSVDSVPTSFDNLTGITNDLPVRSDLAVICNVPTNVATSGVSRVPIRPTSGPIFHAETSHGYGHHTPLSLYDCARPDQGSSTIASSEPHTGLGVNERSSHLAPGTQCKQDAHGNECKYNASQATQQVDPILRQEKIIKSIWPHPTAAARLKAPVFCKLYDCIKAYNTPNYLGAKITIPSGLRLDEWFVALAHYQDKEICQYLQYGWPLGYHKDSPPVSLEENHQSALQHMDDVRAFVKKGSSFRRL